MKANAQTDAQVRATLTRLADAYESRDLTAVLECFGSDADVLVYGTGADEKRVGPDEIRTQVERDWAQTESIAMSFAWMSVSASDRVAWAAVDGAFSFTAGGESGTMPVRITFVLEQREGRWLIVQAHYSVPAAGQEEGHSL